MARSRFLFVFFFSFIVPLVCLDFQTDVFSDRAQSQDGQKQSADFFASTANSHPSVKRCQASLEPVI